MKNHKNKTRRNKNQNKSPEKLMGKLADKWLKNLWDKLLDKLVSVKSKKDLKQILESLLSEDEKKMILRRLAVIALVRSGKSYRKIGEILWTSPQTISTIKKNIFNKTNHYKSYVSFYKGPTRWSTRSPKIEESSTYKDVLLDILNFIENALPPSPKGIGIIKGDPRLSSQSNRKRK